MTAKNAPRDIERELRHDLCWDSDTQRIFERTGEPTQDRILQTRGELVAFCRFIEQNRIRSYLEIGVWTGRLVCALHRLFRFDRVAACDDGYARGFGFELHLPDDAHFFEGNSRSEAFCRWRAGLGHVDLVLIDADHSLVGSRADFEINRLFSHRFLAFHDITGANRFTAGVNKLWQTIRRSSGHTLEILRPHTEIGAEQSTMGIGIWSETEIPRLDPR